ncbi:hypothetical protein [Saccharothrix obliqua]|uniref:hypothetical protein n=1 Tax=Saccharothrix obliqua TaxID=2861747 RepID=UPI001C5DA29E|nr:hypothetical protein [Saccharothrix obliqua]MBW4716654.1 hypothetical protein [Saccharothrix obliqua]
MFEQDRPAAPKRKIPSTALLAGGGALVATVIVTLASMLATNGEPETAPPQPRADLEATAETTVRVAADGTPSTVVITVSTRAGKPTTTEPPGPAKQTGDAAAAPRPVESPARPTAQVPAPTTRTEEAAPTTSQPQSNPPTSYHPTTEPPSSAATTPVPTSEAKP